MVTESQKKRFANDKLVNRILELDDKWRIRRGNIDFLNKHVRQVSKWIGQRAKVERQLAAQTAPDQDASVRDRHTTASLAHIFDQHNNDIHAVFSNEQTLRQLQQLDTNQLKRLSKAISSEWIVNTTAEMNQFQHERDSLLKEIGNLVHESVPISNTEDKNLVLKEHRDEDTFTRLNGKENLLNHVEIMTRLQQMHTERGAQVAGSRSYYLSGDLVRLNMALIQYAMDFMLKRGYTPIQPPYFMEPSIAKEVAQLDQFDEELYTVSDGHPKHDKYLIATSEQPLCAFHRHEWIESQRLPIRYVGHSTCFRKEAGSHGRDTLGIFRVHQFEKVEQFCLTTPEDSWRMMDEMLGNSEEFFASLGISYRLVSIVSGKLNNAAAKKVDLEAYFPSSNTYRELVSCSNCTDYQSSRLKIRLGTPGSESKEFVHMLNATLCATSRTMCCIVETHQTEEGIRIPEVLRKYGFGDQDMIRFDTSRKHNEEV